jgi:hypothetical protein
MASNSPLQSKTTDQLYTQTQIGWVVLIFFGIIAIFSLTMLYLGKHKGPEIFAFGPLVPMILYPTMTIQVYENRLRFFMGPGLIGKSFRFEDIVSCQPVRNRWWHGWGMAYNKDGWIYNVSGFGAIAIEIQHGEKRRKYRLGSAEPERAAAAIQQAMKEAGCSLEQVALPRTLRKP